MLNRREIKKFLSECPHKDFIEFLLKRVNLSELENEVINYKINKKLSNEKISEILNKSSEYTHKLVRNTLDKLVHNWNEIFEYINKEK